MKRSKILSIVLAFAAVLTLSFGFASCSAESSGGGSSGNSGGSSSERSLFYWDESSNAFVGKVTWNAKTDQQKAMLVQPDLLISSVYWKISPRPEIMYGMADQKVAATYSVYTDIANGVYTLTATVRATDCFQWSDVPNVTVSACIEPFATDVLGDEIVMATQDGYGGCEDGTAENHWAGWFETQATVSSYYDYYAYVHPAAGNRKIKARTVSINGLKVSFDWTDEGLRANYGTPLYNVFTGLNGSNAIGMPKTDSTIREVQVESLGGYTYTFTQE